MKIFDSTHQVKQIHNNWKKRFRETLFNWLPAGIYLKVVPTYFRLFNTERRACAYSFSRDEQGRFILHGKNEKFYFVDHRRINRYMFPDGIDRIHQSMLAKYTKGECTINENDIVVEVGANVGEFTQAAANIAHKIYAFEPDPLCLMCLEENVKQLSNVVVNDQGVFNQDGIKTFYLSSEDADSSFIQPKKYSKTINIKATRLETWMHKENIQIINFLKVEAEGGELEVLESLGSEIKNVQKISVDGGPERYGESTYEAVSQFLLNKGFRTNCFGNMVYAIKK